MEASLALSVGGIYLLFEVFRTYIYIKTLRKRKKRRYIVELVEEISSLTEQLQQERKENHIMSDILKDLLQEH